VLAPITLGVIWLGGVYFQIFVALGGLLAIWEWWQMCASEQKKARNLIWILAGSVYIAVPCLFLIWLRNDQDNGRIFIIWFFCVIWATDIGAYVFGKAIGGIKLAPRISPNKTWAGFIGGLMSAMVIAWALTAWHGSAIAPQVLIALSALLSLTGQIGDLIESWVKRYFDVKDSGKIIPGHGGILDRVDAILLAVPVAAIIGMTYGIGNFPWK